MASYTKIPRGQFSGISTYIGQNCKSMNSTQLMYWIKCNTLATKREYRLFAVGAGFSDDEVSEADKCCDMFKLGETIKCAICLVNVKQMENKWMSYVLKNLERYMCASEEEYYDLMNLKVA